MSRWIKVLEKIQNGDLKFRPFCGPHKWQHANSERILISECLRPFSNDYFHPLNPSFLYEYANLESMQEFPVICARDGVSTLVDFFLDHPNPPHQFPLILVQEALTSLIPATWRENALGFSLRPRADVHRLSENRDAELLITGMAHKSYVTENYLEIVSKAAKNYKEINGLVFMEDDPFYNPQEEVVDFVFNFIQNISLAVTRPIKFYSYQEILKNISPENVHYLDLGSDLFSMSDNSFEHYLLSRGAIPVLQTRNLSSELYSLNLSPYHRLAITPLQDPCPIYLELDFVREDCLYADPGQLNYYFALKELSQRLVDVR